MPNDPAQWRIAHYLEQFEAIRATLGITRWLVCGQSFGAGIMIRYACSHSDAVAGLVITNSRSAIAEDLARDRPQRGLAAWRAISPASLPFHPRHARRFPPALQRRMEAAADRVNAETLWRSTMITAPELCSRALLPEIPVPTLLVNGRWETAFQADRDHAARTVPDITVADLDGGHSVNIEAPGDFNAALQAFAARCI